MVPLFLGLQVTKSTTRYVASLICSRVSEGPLDAERRGLGRASEV